jgi:hypothetical protein
MNQSNQLINLIFILIGIILFYLFTPGILINIKGNKYFISGIHAILFSIIYTLIKILLVVDVENLTNTTGTTNTQSNTAKAPTVTNTAKAPTVTNTAKAPTVTNTAKAPTVTNTAKAPTVTNTAKTPTPTVASVAATTSAKKKNIINCSSYDSVHSTSNDSTCTQCPVIGNTPTRALGYKGLCGYANAYNKNHFIHKTTKNKCLNKLDVPISIPGSNSKTKYCMSNIPTLDISKTGAGLNVNNFKVVTDELNNINYYQSI